jgi:hypothetical protein
MAVEFVCWRCRRSFSLEEDRAARSPRCPACKALQREGGAGPAVERPVDLTGLLAAPPAVTVLSEPAWRTVRQGIGLERLAVAVSLPLTAVLLLYSLAQFFAATPQSERSGVPWGQLVILAVEAVLFLLIEVASLIGRALCCAAPGPGSAPRLAQAGLLGAILGLVGTVALVTSSVAGSLPGTAVGLVLILLGAVGFAAFLLFLRRLGGYLQDGATAQGARLVLLELAFGVVLAAVAAAAVAVIAAGAVAGAEGSRKPEPAASEAAATALLIAALAGAVYSVLLGLTYLYTLNAAARSLDRGIKAAFS